MVYIIFIIIQSIIYIVHNKLLLENNFTVDCMRQRLKFRRGCSLERKYVDFLQVVTKIYTLADSLVLDSRNHFFDTPFVSNRFI